MKRKRLQRLVMLMFLLLLAVSLSDLWPGFNLFKKPDTAGDGSANSQVRKTTPKPVSFSAMSRHRRSDGEGAGEEGDKGIHVLPKVATEASISPGVSGIDSAPHGYISLPLPDPVENLIAESLDQSVDGFIEHSGFGARSMWGGDPGYASAYPLMGGLYDLLENPEENGATLSESAAVPEPATSLLVLAGFGLGVAVNRCLTGGKNRPKKT